MRFLRSAVLVGLSLAVTLSAADPPPEVDAALRARIEDFYQLQVDRKFRQAEQLVAADTKDFYYESRKPDLRTIEITEIQYTPDFQTAKVTLASRMQIMIPGAPPQVMNIPFASYWKIERGEWCWYIDRDKLLDTPFGRVKEKGSGATQDLATLKERISTAGLMDGVHADPMIIELDLAKPPAVQIIKLKNFLPGPVTVQSINSPPALTIEIAKPDLGADESTVAIITFTGSSERPGQVTLRILPMGQIIALPIHYPDVQ